MDLAINVSVKFQPYFNIVVSVVCRKMNDCIMIWRFPVGLWK